MSTDKLARVIDEAFEGRDKIGPKTKGAVRKAVEFRARSPGCRARRASPNATRTGNGTSING